jgi:NAD(P)-dependent dehydrogenase (short-subunit alcohol dehydrogenase family)
MTRLERMFGLRGRTALVTGGSSGLGVAFAQALAGAGADVAVVARREDRLSAMVQELEALGVRGLAVTADLTTDEPERIFSEVERGLGPVDILVNNAGITRMGLAETMPPADWEQVLAVNLTAVFRMAQGAARGMIDRGHGRIINIASIIGMVASPLFPVASYTASKGAVVSLTRQLAIDWAPYGITVNCIAPGYVRSEMNVDPRFGDIHPKYKQMMIDQVPLGRVGHTDDLKGAVVYLASPAASYVTGTVLVVDGGCLAR